MSSFEEAVRLQERLNKQLNLSGLAAIYSQVYTPGLAEVMDIHSRFVNMVHMSVVNPIVTNIPTRDYTSWIVAASGLGQFAEAGRIAQEAICAAGGYDALQRTAEIIQLANSLPNGFWEVVNNIKVNAIDMSGLARAVDILSEAMLLQQEVISNFKSVIDCCYSDIQLNIPDDPSIILTDEEIEMIEAIGKGEISEDEIKEKDSVTKTRIVTVITTILFGLLTNFLTYMIEPLYHTINPIKLLMENSSESPIVAEIPKDIEITVWSNDMSQDYIEISYMDGDVYRQGYIEKKDIENNTIQILDSCQFDEILFTNSCVELMAEFWKMESGEAYNRLCMETNLMNDYIVPNYMVLSTISEEDLIKEIHEHYIKIEMRENTVSNDSE